MAGRENGSGGLGRSTAPDGRGELAAVGRGQTRFRERMEMQIEADQRRRGVVVLCIRQLVDVDRKDRDLVVMRLVAGRRTGAAIAVSAEIRPALNGSLRHP